MLSTVPFIATLTPELSAKTITLFTVHSRYGNNALNGDWELGITSNTNAPPQQQRQRTWGSGVTEQFSFSFTNSLDGSFTIGGSSVQASYPDRLARGEPNAIKIWARTTTAGSGLTINDLKIKTPGLADPTVFAGTSITVSNSPGNEFRELIIAGIDFQSLSSGEVTLEGSATMQFGSQPAPRGSSLQFHVIAAHIRDDVTITATNAIASEDPSLGPDQGEFVISRGEGNVTGDLKVAFRVPATVPAPLSIASLGADYTLSVGGAPISLSASGEGAVTIPDGKSSVSIRLAVEPDAILEWDETARVELLPAPTGSQPYGIVPNRGSADVTILDDELLGGMLSRNVDGESTGLSSATVDLGAASIDLAQGEATVSLPLVLSDFGPRYTSHDNLRPIVALETQLPLAGTEKTGLSVAGVPNAIGFRAEVPDHSV
jgi:hypothetical protein